MPNLSSPEGVEAVLHCFSRDLRALKKLLIAINGYNLSLGQ